MFVFKPPICVMVPADAQNSKLERVNVSAMHIVPRKQDAVRLKRALRRTVTVRGTISESITAWHQGDAIMFEAEIVDTKR